MPVENNNGWGEWSRHVLIELERHNRLHEASIKEMNRLNSRLTAIEVKSGLWGGLSGLAAVVAYAFLGKG